MNYRLIVINLAVSIEYACKIDVFRIKIRFSH